MDPPLLAQAGAIRTVDLLVDTYYIRAIKGISNLIITQHAHAELDNTLYYNPAFGKEKKNAQGRSED